MPELELSVSATTRPPRAGESDGRDYHFLEPDGSMSGSTPGIFSSTRTYSGNQYGTLRSEVERRIAARAPVVLEIEVQGARQVRASDARGSPVFIAPPTTRRYVSG